MVNKYSCYRLQAVYVYDLFLSNGEHERRITADLGVAKRTPFLSYPERWWQDVHMTT